MVVIRDELRRIASKNQRVICPECAGVGFYDAKFSDGSIVNRPCAVCMKKGLITPEKREKYLKVWSAL